MSSIDLELFGKKLRQFRKERGLTQAKLAEQIPITPELVSRWERAYVYQGRQWKPDRSALVRLVEIFADQISPNVAQDWLALAGYKLSKMELQDIFSGELAQSSMQPSPRDAKANFKQLIVLPRQRLFGVESKRQSLLPVLTQADAPWSIALDGIGGIGKTSLANNIAHEIMQTDRFYDLAWVSAKQEEFSPSVGRQPLGQPALTVDTLIDLLIDQLVEQEFLPTSTKEKQYILTSLLKERPYLIVIDNLETVADYETLIPLLRRLANPTKFLLTSRHSLYTYSDVFCLNLSELEREDALTFLRYEAKTRGLSTLAAASETYLDRIYKVVGGNPLALKLVIGQVRVLPLSHVLENLKQALGKKTEDLYTYIYWQAWQALDPSSQQVLLIMPLAQRGTLDQLSVLSELETAELNRALEHLVALSLVEVSSDIEHHRYYIHRLTETFLLKEVAKWQSVP